MIYISLTTVPLRLSYWKSLKINLESLLQQKTDKDYMVIFNIPKYYAIGNNEEYKLPDELLELSNSNSKLILNRDIYDYGPIIKIYGALKYAVNPDDIIIAVDDDNEYHEDMIESHLNKLNEYPNNVICFSSDVALKKISFIDNGVKKFRMCKSRVDFPLEKDEYMQNPGHTGSVSYRRWMFKDDFNEELFKLADGDDPLMGYYLKKHQICIICSKHNYPGISFPIAHRLPFPNLAGGWLIRKKNNQTIHGRQDVNMIDFLQNEKYEYIEKDNE